ncbi:hypothetical protein C8J57DRAFT_1496895 [Mycena rebaudengoi]|nr:hypothetical protein C8J57DRAFT_1496895 [Mycena rebaudengoi]
MSSTLASLNTDIIVAIFQLVFSETAYGDFWTYVRARNRLCRISSQWFRFIRGTEKFWRSIRASQSVPLELSFHSLSRTKKCSLDIVMSFRRIENHPQVSAYITDWMRELTPFVPRWRSLRIEVDDPAVLVRIHLALRSLSAPLLRTLSVQCHRKLHVHPEFRQSTSMSWFSAGLRNLTSLHLCGASMPAASFASLVGLRKLNIEWLDGRIRPLSVAEFVSVLTAVPLVEDLQIGHVICADSHYPEPQRSINLPHLRRLRLSFATPDSIHLVAPLMVAPALHSVSFRCTRREHIVAALQCAPFFSSASRIGICGRVDEEVQLLPLLSVFRDLRQLDLRGSRSSALAELVAESKRLVVDGRTTFAPSLRRLAVGPSPMVLVRELVLLHSFLSDTGLRVFGLSDVHARYNGSITMLDDEEMEASRWLDAHLPVFRRYTRRGPISGFHVV